MKITIKNKLILGLGFLFFVILLIGGVSSYYIHKLSDESGEIIQNNYETLNYINKMSNALDRFNEDSASSVIEFKKYLDEQSKNITEIGEKEATDELRIEFRKFAMGKTDPAQQKLVRLKLYAISELNMQAILRKSSLAAETSKQALWFVGFVGTISIIIAFSFILSFPGYIANPIHELTESIEEISQKKYSRRLYFSSGDEFGQLADAFNIMAAKLDEYENSNLSEILFQKKRIETIINRMHDPIIGLDDKNKIIFVNHEAELILGINEPELVNQYAPDVALKNDLLRMLLNVEVFSSPVKIFSKGKEWYYSVDKLNVTSKDELIGKVILLKNITDFKELDVAKTNFIATISHELKTPIAAIKMSLKLLDDNRVGELNEEQKKLLDHIKDDSERLLKITSELLDLAQVETGQIHLHYQPASPLNIINYACEALRFTAEQKKITLNIYCPPDLPMLSIDMEKTTWVLLNFISNAIRYAPENSSVMVKAYKEGKKIIFAVHDKGSGISTKYQARIFEKYFKVPGKESGTGLGLAISKEFILAQKGEIWLESEEGKGSTFYFSFPVN